MSCQKVSKKYHSLKSAFSIDFNTLPMEMQGKKPAFRQGFLIQISDRFRKVEINDIAYFHAFEKNVVLKTFEGNSYPVDESLDWLENIINPAQFFRINRRYIVSMKSIVGMVAWSRSRIKIDLKPKCVNEMDSIVSIDRTADFKN